MTHEDQDQQRRGGAERRLPICNHIWTYLNLANGLMPIDQWKFYTVNIYWKKKISFTPQVTSGLQLCALCWLRVPRGWVPGEWRTRRWQLRLWQVQPWDSHTELSYTLSPPPQSFKMNYYKIFMYDLNYLYKNLTNIYLQTIYTTNSHKHERLLHL